MATVLCDEIGAGHGGGGYATVPGAASRGWSNDVLEQYFLQKTIFYRRETDLMAEAKSHIKLAVKSHRLAAELERVILQNKNFHLLPLTEKRRPDLLVYEIGPDAGTDFQRIQTILESEKTGELFLTAKEIDPDLLVKAMRLGVKEFLSQPLDKAELDQALDRYRKRAIKVPALYLPETGR